MLRAEKLPSSVFDKPDAYVKLSLGEETRVSRVQSDSEKPVFNQEFVFALKEQPTNQQLSFQVLDKDVVSDDLLCTASKGLQKVLETPETWFWLDEPIKLLDAQGKRSPARLAVQAIFNAHSQQEVPLTLIKGEGLVPN